MTAFMCAGTWCPQLVGVVGDLAADGGVHYCLPLSPLPPAGVPVLIVVLDEAGTQDLWLAVQDDDERPLDMVPHPATVVHNLPARLANCVRQILNGCVVC